MGTHPIFESVFDCLTEIYFIFYNKNMYLLAILNVVLLIRANEYDPWTTDNELWDKVRGVYGSTLPSVGNGYYPAKRTFDNPPLDAVDGNTFHPPVRSNKRGMAGALYRMSHF